MEDGAEALSSIFRYGGGLVYTARVEENVELKRPWVGALPWAVYLGVSWTWCIGMFLPVLLLRDFGLTGFWVFAIPNVIGAAAMGFVLRRAEQSREFVEKHRAACVAFSVITILFHIFFAAWLIRTFVVAGWVVMVWGLMRVARAGERWAAIGVYVMSMIAALLIWQRGSLVPVPTPVEVEPTKLLGLALVCLLGFALCPYLDLTFHRARQETDAGGAKVAFAVGFGVFFFSMILFTLMYAGVILAWLEPRVPARSEGVRLAQVMVGIHMAVQAGFTIAAHGSEMGRVATKKAWVVLVVAGAALAVLGTYVSQGGRWLGIDRGEVVYRLFLSFYGLLFPAYLLICGRRGLNGVDGAWLAVAVIVAAPFYYLGFMMGRMEWVMVGVGVVAVVGMMRQMGRQGAPTERGHPRSTPGEGSLGS